jgi:hypothetical protein
MHIEQRSFSESSGWIIHWTTPGFAHDRAQLVFVFCNYEVGKNPQIYPTLKDHYPNAYILMVSTAGEILDTHVNDDSVSVSAIMFEKTNIQAVQTSITDMDESMQAGAILGKKLLKDNLKHVFVFSAGIGINWDQLIRGIKSEIPPEVTLSGWLAGDGTHFEHTYVTVDAVPDENKNIVLIGLYGSDIDIWLWSVGGWDSFWVDRIVTRSVGSIVYELDNKPILDLYKLYLWDTAKDLPASWLLFPLTIIDEEKWDMVRTLLSIDEKEKSITFAWDVPVGATVRLMKANFNRLIWAAGEAASTALAQLQDAEFILLISCVWRKIILKQRVEEEIENVREICGKAGYIAGFYSYGEIGRSMESILNCQLHNQTMTVTLMSEK